MEEESIFDMEFIRNKVKNEMKVTNEKKLKKNLGDRYYKSIKKTDRQMPPPRALNQHINIKFTPRDRPTAARETEDEKYRNHMKRQMAIKETLDKLKDSKGIEEQNAIFLKEKGNNFFKQENYEAAINAYTSAIELEPENIGCISNRAACYLKLKNYEKSQEDCNKGIEVLNSIKEKFDEDVCNSRSITIPFTRKHEESLMKFLLRRATASIGMKKYKDGK